MYNGPPMTYQPVMQRIHRMKRMCVWPHLLSKQHIQGDVARHKRMNGMIGKTYKDVAG